MMMIIIIIILIILLGNSLHLIITYLGTIVAEHHRWAGESRAYLGLFWATPWKEKTCEFCAGQGLCCTDQSRPLPEAAKWLCAGLRKTEALLDSRFAMSVLVMSDVEAVSDDVITFWHLEKIIAFPFFPIVIIVILHRWRRGTVRRDFFYTLLFLAHS